MGENDLRRKPVEVADDDLASRPSVAEYRTQSLFEVRAGPFGEGQGENALVPLQ